MNTKKILIKSADISEERIKELAAMPVEKRTVSEAERATYTKSAIFSFLLGIGMIILGGLLAFTPFVEGYGAFGIIALLIGGVIFIIKSPIYYYRNFRDIRNKTSEKALITFFNDVLMGGDFDDFDKKLTSYSYGVLRRMIPELYVLDYKEYTDYLRDFRIKIKQSVDNGYSEFFNDSPPPYEYRLNLSFDFAKDEKTSTETHMSKTKAVLKYYLHSTKTNNRIYYVDFDVTLELLLIKSGDFWFVADPMPEYTVIDEEPTIETEAETEKSEVKQ
jgi:hypothetical protein